MVDNLVLVFGRIMLAIEQSFSPKTGMWKDHLPQNSEKTKKLMA
ncbi:hypothetical protein [Mongoliibacter ruber]|nr:hypothetical protein [Mongoliibacter ruber]